MVYPDYVKAVDSAGNSVSCPDLSKMDSDDDWKIVADTVYRSVANVNIIKQPFRDMVFCYELEVV
ncbi:hypothetical protein DY78_GL002362 [Lactiplantibacillus fabifermentans DSM 21115]|uniref:Uncharacterized protein n=1 Tax=Lactiplantibacillus fabifermentans DSM 21115 TaxID=1413187 RepID=A0A0R2NS18_9LACO|nr:hypothetical protein DY78_GL002362 [Lactiplantibacillus fabifermentans DSM 21115]